jgi:hypothetical protein
MTRLSRIGVGTILIESRISQPNQPLRTGFKADVPPLIPSLLSYLLLDLFCDLQYDVSYKVWINDASPKRNVQPVICGGDV